MVNFLGILYAFVPAKLLYTEMRIPQTMQKWRRKLSRYPRADSDKPTLASLEVPLLQYLAQGEAIPDELAEALCSACREPVTRFLARNGLTASAVDDLTQDVLLAIACHVNGFRGDSSLTTWVNRIAVNKLIDYRKRGRREIPISNYTDDEANGPEGGSSDWLETAPPVMGGPSVAMARSPEVLVIERDEDRRIAAGLTREQWVVFSLVKRGYSYQEIGHTLGLSGAQVRGRLARAKEAMRRQPQEG